jgi:hypothetical protein
MNFRSPAKEKEKVRFLPEQNFLGGKLTNLFIIGSK